MARTLIAASTRITSLAARQPRLAIGGAGLGGILLLELLVLLFAGQQVL